MLAGDNGAAFDFRDRSAGDFPFLRGCQRCLGRNDLGELLSLCQLAETKRPIRRLMQDFSADHGQRRSLDTEAFGCEIEQQIPSGRCNSPQLRSHARSRPAAGGSAVERGQLSIGHHEIDLLDGNPQLFRHRLAQRGAGVLSDLHLSGEGRDAAGVVDVQPGSDFLRHPHSTPKPSPAAPRWPLKGGEFRIHRQADNDSAAQKFAELAAAEAELISRRLVQFIAFWFRQRIRDGERVHRTAPSLRFPLATPFFIALAAAWIAAMMRR